MTPQDRSSCTVDGFNQLIAQHLHRSPQVPEAQRGLGHVQNGCSVKGRGAIGGFLGIQLQLQIKKPSQPGIVGTAAKPHQVQHRQTREQTRRQRWKTQGADQLTEIPE